MIRIIFAITLSILIFAGCGRNISPDRKGREDFSDNATSVESNAKNDEKPMIDKPTTETPPPENSKPAETEQLMSEDEIKKIALEWVEGATESDIREFKKERDDGRWEYDVKIIYNNTEYELEINATTGEIITWDKESAYDD